MATAPEGIRVEAWGEDMVSSAYVGEFQQFFDVGQQTLGVFFGIEAHHEIAKGINDINVVNTLFAWKAVEPT